MSISVDPESSSNAATTQIVIIIDDEPELRAALGATASAMGCEVQCFSRGADFLDQPNVDSQYNHAQGVCLFLDYRLPNMTGIELMREAKKRQIATPVVLITGHLESQVAVEAMQCGAVTCLQKPMSLQAIRKSMQLAFVATDRIRSASEGVKVDRQLLSLSTQERNVVMMVVDGSPNKDIAAKMEVSIKTVEKYRRRAYLKLGVANTANLVRKLTIHSLANNT